MRNILFASTLAVLTLPPAAAFADPPPWAPAHGRRAKERHHGLYDSRGRYYEPRRISRDDYMWRGNDGRYYCRRSNGTTGLVVGAAVGGLVGYSLDRGRDRTVGTIIGMAGGALLGRAIDRGDLRCH